MSCVVEIAKLVRRDDLCRPDRESSSAPTISERGGEARRTPRDLVR
jgi:hypothetical protein